MKALVTKITKMDKKDSYGNTSFVIEFDNGDKGFYVSKNESQTKFILLEEAEYNIEKKVGSTSGKEYFKITVPQAEGAKPFSGGGFKQDPKVQMISFSASYTKDLVVGGKVPMADFEKEFNKIYNLMIGKL